MLWTKHTASFSPQRKPRPCSPPHIEAFLNADPNPVPEACSCYVAEYRISRLLGVVGEECNFWSSVWHGLFSSTTPLRSKPLVLPKKRNAPSPCRADWPQPPSPQQLLQFQPLLPPWSQPLLPSRLTAPAIFGSSSSCHPYPFLILTRTLHSFLIPTASPHTHKKKKGEFRKKKNPNKKQKSNIWASNHLLQHYLSAIETVRC